MQAGQSGRQEGRGYIGSYRDPVLVLIYCVLTLGIYNLYQVYQVCKELNSYQDQRPIPASYVLWSILFFPLYYYLLYRIDQSLFALDLAEGRFPQYRFILWLLLSFVGLGAFVSAYQIQESMNQIWAPRSGKVHSLSPGLN